MTKHKLRATLTAAVVLLSVLLTGSPAAAGNWAVTSLDPLPDRIEAGRPYTVGFWVLQHGTHPFSGVMEPVGLRLVDQGGTELTFPGTALKEPAHYAAAMLVPKAGTWQVYGVQGPFQPYLVGTLTVPGGLTVLPVPVPLPAVEAAKTWGAIRPPQVPVDPARDPFADPAQPVAKAVTVTAEPGSDANPLAWVAGTALVVAAGAGFLLVARRRSTRDRSPRQELVG